MGVFPSQQHGKRGHESSHSKRGDTAGSLLLVVTSFFLLSNSESLLFAVGDELASESLSIKSQILQTRHRRALQRDGRCRSARSDGLHDMVLSFGDTQKVFVVAQRHTTTTLSNKQKTFSFFRCTMTFYVELPSVFVG